MGRVLAAQSVWPASLVREASRVAAHPATLIDRGPITWFRHTLACFKCCFDPGGLRFLKLQECLCRRPAEGRTVAEIGDVGDVTVVFLALKNIDVMLFHDLSSKDSILV